MEISEKIKDRSAVVCVVGVGYVGFPLAEVFSEHLKVIGYDLNGKKVGELNNKTKNSNLIFTSNPAEIKKADFILIAVPTPVTESKEPDLFCVKSSVETVGKNLKKGAVVVLESTVYPGVTEDIVKPILEKSSGMKCGVDFKIGYSPERINPGDDAHGIGNITKIVSGWIKRPQKYCQNYTVWSLLCLKSGTSGQLKLLKSLKISRGILISH